MRKATVATASPLLLFLASLSSLPLACRSQQVKPQQLSEPNIDGALFNCDGRQDGYYADMADDCNGYYRCVRHLRLFHFSCPAGTRFNQLLLVCDHARRVNCSVSPTYFGRSVQLQAIEALKTSSDKLKSDLSSSSTINSASSQEKNDGQRKDQILTKKTIFSPKQRIKLPTKSLRPNIFAFSPPNRGLPANQLVPDRGKVAATRPETSRDRQSAETGGEPAAKLLAVSLGSLHGFNSLTGDALPHNHEDASGERSPQRKQMEFSRRHGSRAQSLDIPDVSPSTDPPLPVTELTWRPMSFLSPPARTTPRTEEQESLMQERTRELSGVAHRLGGVFFSPLLWLGDGLTSLTDSQPVSLNTGKLPSTTIGGDTGHRRLESPFRFSVNSIVSGVGARPSSSLLAGSEGRSRQSDIKSGDGIEECSHCLSTLIIDRERCLPCVRAF